MVPFHLRMYVFVPFATTLSGDYLTSPITVRLYATCSVPFQKPHWSHQCRYPPSASTCFGPFTALPHADLWPSTPQIVSNTLLTAKPFAYDNFLSSDREYHICDSLSSLFLNVCAFTLSQYVVLEWRNHMLTIHPKSFMIRMYVSLNHSCWTAYWPVCPPVGRFLCLLNDVFLLSMLCSLCVESTSSLCPYPFLGIN